MFLLKSWMYPRVWVLFIHKSFLKMLYHLTYCTSPTTSNIYLWKQKNCKIHLVHVGENQKAQLLSNIHSVHSEIIFQLRNWDEPVQLKQKTTDWHQLHAAMQFSHMWCLIGIFGLAQKHRLFLKTQNFSFNEQYLHFCPSFPCPGTPASFHMPWPS